LYKYVVVRDVNENPQSMNELTRFWPSGGVPTLVYQGHYIAGDADQVIAALKKLFSQGNR